MLGNSGTGSLPRSAFYAVAWATGNTTAHRTLPRLRLRPPRLAGQVSRVRHARRDDTRMRRRLLNLLTALSLLLCVAVCVLWARSYWHRESLYRAEMSPEGLTLTRAARLFM